MEVRVKGKNEARHEAAARYQSFALLGSTAGIADLVY